MRSTLHVRDNRDIPQEVEVLSNEGFRELDNTVATTFVRQQLHQKGVDMPPPSIPAAVNSELPRFAIPRLGVPAHAEPGLARTMSAFDPKASRKPLSLSANDFTLLYDALVLKFTKLDAHMRIGMTHLLDTLVTLNPDIVNQPGVGSTCTHLLEIARQHKLILGHEVAIALKMVSAPGSRLQELPLFPINLAVENATRSVDDDDLRRHVEKRDRADDDDATPSAKRSKDGGKTVTSNTTTTDRTPTASAIHRAPTVSPRGNTAAVAPASGTSKASATTTTDHTRTAPGMHAGGADRGVSTAGTGAWAGNGSGGN
jgi:hypothetical protein